MRILILMILVLSTVVIGPAFAQNNPDEQTETPPPNPPKEAMHTSSGLAYLVLKKGEGNDHPQAQDRVTVHYTGWTTDGKMFDSSLKRGKPVTFPLDGVIKGWTEGLQLMVPGEKTRFWIPPELAYGNNPRGGRPAGTLIFDVELISIEHVPTIQAPIDLKNPPAEAVSLSSGSKYKVLKPGQGKVKPKDIDEVTVHYTVWSPEGKMLDTTVLKNKPVTLGLNQSPPGWEEILSQMSEGEKVRAWIPLPKAMGKEIQNPSQRFLVFELELVKVNPKQSIPAPPNVSAPPKEAIKTASGLAYIVLKEGYMSEHPKSTDRVKVHYTGWTTDGKMFDSSVSRGKPITFPLNRVIKGWTEALQLMVPGEKARFWIPAPLAYGNHPRGGRPGGMLVFDIELLEINPEK